MKPQTDGQMGSSVLEKAILSRMGPALTLSARDSTSVHWQEHGNTKMTGGCLISTGDHSHAPPFWAVSFL